MPPIRAIQGWEFLSKKKIVVVQNIYGRKLKALAKLNTYVVFCAHDISAFSSCLCSTYVYVLCTNIRIRAVCRIYIQINVLRIARNRFKYLPADVRCACVKSLANCNLKLYDLMISCRNKKKKQQHQQIRTRNVAQLKMFTR